MLFNIFFLKFNKELTIYLNLWSAQIWAFVGSTTPLYRVKDTWNTIAIYVAGERSEAKEVERSEAWHEG